MKQIRVVYLLAALLLLQVPVLAAQDQPADQEPQPADSADTATEPVSRPMVSLGVGAQALAEAYPDQARWLDTGADERVLVMFEKEQTAQPKGAILILADEGQTANTQLAGALRQPLARAGWAAMAMGLPELPLALAQARRLREASGEGAADAEAGDQGQAGGGEAETEASVMIDVMTDGNLESLAQQYESRLQASLEAALSELRDQGYQRLVLVAVGRGAAPATRQALAGSQGVQELVWVAPTLPENDALALAAQLEALSMPVLDLASSRRQDGAPKERAAIMRRQGVADYSQQTVAMAPRPVAHNAGQVANRILAWLSR